MLGAALLALLGLGFFAFIGLAPKALTQLALALMWLVLALSVPIGIGIELLR